MTDFTERQVLDILRDPFSLPWTIQGFGMLRLYLDEGQVHRLHIWDQNMAVEDVSSVHDHPWDLDSTVISGTLRNQRFLRDGEFCVGAQPWKAVLIRTGEGGHPLVDAPEEWWLRPQDLEVYGPGDAYHQDAPEIHESLPMPGCVTVVKRTFSRQRDIATSCFLAGEWVSAEPRPATRTEIQHFIDLALTGWGEAELAA